MHRSFASLRMTNSEGFRIFNSAADKSSTPRLPAPACDSAAISQTLRRGRTSSHAPRSRCFDHSPTSTPPMPPASSRSPLASSREVEKHIIESGPRRLQLPQRFPSVDADDLEPAGNPQRLQVGGNHVRSCSRRLDEVHHPRPAAQRFNANRARPRIQIDPSRLRQCRRIARAEYVKQRLAQAIRCRTDLRSRQRPQRPASILSSNHSHRSQPIVSCNHLSERPRECFFRPSPSDSPFRISAGWVGV